MHLTGMLFLAFAVPKMTTILLEGKFVRLQLWLVYLFSNYLDAYGWSSEMNGFIRLK